MVDALFYVGRAADNRPRVAEAKRLYGLDALIPADFEQPTLTAVDRDALRALRESLEYSQDAVGPDTLRARSRTCTRSPPRSSTPKALHSVSAPARSRRCSRPSAKTTADFAALSGDVRESLGARGRLGPALRRLRPRRAAAATPSTSSARVPCASACAPARRTAAARIDAVGVGARAQGAGPHHHGHRGPGKPGHVARDRTAARQVLPRARQPRGPAGDDAMFEQLAGVLSVLGFEEAVAALRNVQTTVARLRRRKWHRRARRAFGRVAQNLGALGFFVESLAQDSDRPRGVFRYDPLTRPSPRNSAAARTTRSRRPTTSRYSCPRRSTCAGRSQAPRERRGGGRAASLRRCCTGGPACGGPGQCRRAAGAQPHGRAAVNEADLIDDAALKQKATRAVQLLTRTGTAGRAVAAELHALFVPPPAVQAPPPTRPRRARRTRPTRNCARSSSRKPTRSSIDRRAGRAARALARRPGDDHHGAPRVPHAQGLEPHGRHEDLRRLRMGDRAVPEPVPRAGAPGERRSAQADRRSARVSARLDRRARRAIRARSSTRRALVPAAQGVRDGQPFVGACWRRLPAVTQRPQSLTAARRPCRTTALPCRQQPASRRSGSSAAGLVDEAISAT